MHIDNIPPSCNIPNDLKSWHWYYGNESRTITVTNISELLDETMCKVYDNGKAIDFTYSAAEGSLSFTLNGGWHNVGITLEDVAGNTYSVQEVDNIHIGYFWLWIIIIASVIFIGITITIVYFVRKSDIVKYIDINLIWSITKAFKAESYTPFLIDLFVLKAERSIFMPILKNWQCFVDKYP